MVNLVYGDSARETKLLSRRDPSFRPYGQKLLLVDAGADEDAAVDPCGE